MRSARAAVLSAALALALMSAAMAIPAGCAHINTPTGFVACLENSKDEKAAEDIIFALIDKDADAALEAALSAAPDVVKCLLQRAAGAKGAGPTESARARKARAFLDARGLSMDRNPQKKGGGQYGAAGVGRSPLETGGRPGKDQPAGSRRASVDPGADDPGALSDDVTSSIAWHWALPFEDTRATATFGAGRCSRGLRDFLVPPYAPGTVCVTDDYTFDVDVWRANYHPAAPAHAWQVDPVRGVLWVDGPPLTEI